MSFRCDVCTEQQESGTRPVKFVVKSRPVVYRDGSRGTEIAKEVSVCATCNLKLKGMVNVSMETATT